MKTNLYKNIGLSLLCGMILTGCGEEEKIGLDPVDSIAPGVPTNIKVENTNGGAFITFEAPAEDDLLCVMASYMINGVERTTKASPYVNKLKVEGFGAVGEYDVTLKSVDKSKNESEPVIVKVQPLTPPVEIIYNSLKIVDSFGGVKLAWENKTEDNVIIEAFKKDGDEWLSIENFYSNAKEGKATIRGLDPESITMRFRIRDRWNNYSDFLETENLPLEEIELDKVLFREVVALPGDATPMGNYPIRYIWDGNTVKNCFHSAGGGVNKTITFDLGVKAKLSRFKMWQRTEASTWIYNHNNLKRYVIYGCNELTEEMYESGIEIDEEVFPTFEGWTKIMDVETYKPSGESGKVTNEDKEYILNGDEQEVPIEAPSFRYIRILMEETWSGGIYTQIGEMSFWGQIVE